MYEVEKMNDKPISEELAKQNGNGSKDSRNDDLARKLRASLLVTMLFFAYSLLAVLSTTDMILLREEVIALPIIQAIVPIVEFYYITPLFLVLLHLYLLSKLILYTREIYDTEQTFREAQGWFGKGLIILFLFEQKNHIHEVKNGSFIKFFIFTIFILIFIVIPLSILLIMWIRFLAYQDIMITLWHIALIVFDLFFQFVFARNFCHIFRPEEKLSRVPRGVILVCLASIYSLFFFVWKVLLVEHAHITIQNKVISLQVPPPAIVGATIQFKSSLNPKIHCEHVGYFELGLRHLNFADFGRSKFLCVNMIRTQLKNSNLVDTYFIEADLTEANMSGANLRGAVLSEANLDKANLSYARLQKAVLSGATLIEAKLIGADLRYAVLSTARLFGVDLSAAKLVGADLNMAELWWADLSGADLSEAELSEANLKWANLNMAVLLMADLSGAVLTGVDLTGADLRKANMSGAEMYGAILHEAQLDGIKLDDAKLCGANFSGSTPRDTSLGNIDGEKPESWDAILVDIKFGLKKMGYLEKAIDARLKEIVCICDSDLGYVPPTGVNHCGL